MRDPRPLHVATYLSLVVMVGIGTAGLEQPVHRAAALALGLALGVSYALGYRAARRGHATTVYFVAQTALVSALLLLPSRVYDAFTFLFFVLCFQGWLLFSPPAMVCWTVLFLAISSLKVFVERGPEADIGIAFNSIVFVVTAVLGYATQRSELAHRENERLLTELRQAQSQLNELAIAEERNRLARDLHDSVKQQVFAVMMQLGAARVLLGAEAHPAREPVVEAERLAQQAGAELSLLIHELRPAALGARGLAEVLRDYVADWSRQSGVAATLHAEGAERLPPAVEYGLLRVAQEALANVARHSQASAVRVTLRASQRAVTLTVADDGQGFAADGVQRGIGLESMRERMTAMGGRLVIASGPGTGTTVTATWEARDG